MTQRTVIQVLCKPVILYREKTLDTVLQSIVLVKVKTFPTTASTVCAISIIVLES